MVWFGDYYQELDETVGTGLAVGIVLLFLIAAGEGWPCAFQF